MSPRRKEDDCVRSMTLLSPRARDDHSRMIKVWLDENSYRTVMVTSSTTSTEVVSRLVRRVKVKCADPQLHQLHMQVSVLGQVKTVKMEENTRLMDMITVAPWSLSKFILVTEQQVMIRVWDNISQNVVFRSLMISSDTTVGATLKMLHHYLPDVDQDSLGLYEQSELLQFSRRLNDDEVVLKISDSWSQDCKFRFLLDLDKRKKNREDAIDDTFNSRMDDSVDDVNDSSNTSCNSSVESNDSSFSDSSSVNSESFLYVPFGFV